MAQTKSTTCNINFVSFKFKIQKRVTMFTLQRLG